jgi:indole-3-glycerol phosphate synthase
MIRKLFIIGGAIVALLLIAGVIVYQKYLALPANAQQARMTIIVYVPTQAELRAGLRLSQVEKSD